MFNARKSDNQLTEWKETPWSGAGVSHTYGPVKWCIHTTKQTYE